MRLRSFAARAIMLVASGATLALLLRVRVPAPQAAAFRVPPNTNQTALASLAVASSSSATSSRPMLTTAAGVKTPAQPPHESGAAKANSQPETASKGEAGSDEVERIASPYDTAPLPISAVNTDARAALVNIFCQTESGSVRPTSGSGVIIDPRGIILTNAHVAQYIMLSENPAFQLSCHIRIGSPARDAWNAEVLYLPPAWVNEHADEINASEHLGTGEHDYALLAITSSETDEPLPNAFPYLAPDTRQAIGFPGDQVLIASYPAEFLGGSSAETSLYAASSPATIGTLLTFGGGSVDLFSVGGIIEAQSGSSGGPVVNPWDRVIGIVTTTSIGTTTAARDLHALSLNYIDRDLKAQTGNGLQALLSGPPAATLAAFNKTLLPDLLQKYYDFLDGISS